MFPLTFSEQMSGKVGEKDVVVDLNVHIDDVYTFMRDSFHRGTVTGQITIDGEPHDISRGDFELFSKDLEDPSMRHLRYFLLYRINGNEYQLEGRKDIRDDPGPDMIADITTLYSTISARPDQNEPDIQGILKFDPDKFVDLFKSMRSAGTNSAVRFGAKTMFVAFCFGKMAATYLLQKWKDLVD